MKPPARDLVGPKSNQAGPSRKRQRQRTKRRGSSNRSPRKTAAVYDDDEKADTSDHYAVDVRDEDNPLDM